MKYAKSQHKFGLMTLRGCQLLRFCKFFERKLLLDVLAEGAAVRNLTSIHAELYSLPWLIVCHDIEK